MDAQSVADQYFLKRFEPDGDDFIFRPNLRAPGIKVTRAERDRFFADYKRRSRWQTWIFVSVLCAGVVGYVFATVSLHVAVSSLTQLVIGSIFFGSLTGAFFKYYYWVQRAPDRALKDRIPSVPGRSKDEARRAHFKQLTWRQIGAFGAMSVAFLLRVAIGENLLVGWNRLWLAFAIVLLTLLAAAAFRKWQFDHREKSGQAD